MKAYIEEGLAKYVFYKHEERGSPHFKFIEKIGMITAGANNTSLLGPSVIEMSPVPDAEFSEQTFIEVGSAPGNQQEGRSWLVPHRIVCEVFWAISEGGGEAGGLSQDPCHYGQ